MAYALCVSKYHLINLILINSKLITGINTPAIENKD
jgi:hypothetical protein